MEENEIGSGEAFALNEMTKMNKNLKQFNKNMLKFGRLVAVGMVAHALIIRSGMPLKP